MAIDTSLFTHDPQTSTSGSAARQQRVQRLIGVQRTWITIASLLLSVSEGVLGIGRNSDWLDDPSLCLLGRGLSD